MAKLLQLYFAGSIRAGRQDAQLYYSLVELLKSHGKIFTEHVADPNLSEAGSVYSESPAHSNANYLNFQEMLIWTTNSSTIATLTGFNNQTVEK